MRDVAIRRLVLGLLPLVFVLALYAPVVSFPYFWDDVYVLKLLHTASLADLLAHGSWFRFRLFDRLLLLFTYDWAGPQGAAFAHLTSIALGLLNAALVTRMTRELLGRIKFQDEAACLAGVAFALFPTNYRNMAWALSSAHVAVMTATLLALVLAWRFQRTGHPWLLAASLLMSIGAALSSESGVVAGVIVAGYVGLRAWPAFGQRTRWLAVLHGLISLLMAGWIYSHTSGSVGVNTAALFIEKALFFLQMLVYPLGPAMRVMAARLSMSSLVVVPLAGLPTLILILVLTLRSPIARLALFGIFWFGLAASIGWYALTFDYLVNAPHLFYYASAGAVMVWAALFARLLAFPFPSVRRVIISLALLALAANFVWTTRAFQLYQLAVQPLRALIRAADEHPGVNLLAVNLPGWLAWPEPFFPIGNEGAIVLSDESTAQMLLDFNSRGASVRAVQVADLQGSAPYYASLHGASYPVDGLADEIRAAQDVYLTVYQPASVELREVGGVRVSPGVSPAPVARFDNGLFLDTFDFAITSGVARMSLDWRLAAPPSDYALFAHIFDCAGNVLALADGPALGGLFPLRQWRAGEAVHDIRFAALDRASPDGCYAFEIGQFDPLTGQRVPVFDAAGNPYPNDAVSLTYP